MHSTCSTMRVGIVFLALLAFGWAISISPKLHAADQELLQKQQHVIQLLENIVGDLPHEHLLEIGTNYEFEPHLENYENPSVVKYYVGLVQTGHVQPKGTPFSVSISVLRKEVALLTQVLLGAKNYETFLHTAAWARVHVNQHQFVTAFASAVLQRHDTQGIILPPVYEVYPHYFFDSKIIQKVYEHVLKHGLGHHEEGEHGHHVHHIYVNETSYLPHGENQIAYLTEDIGLSAYYSYVHLSSYMIHLDQHYSHGQGYQKGEQEVHLNKVGHGAHYYYIHQQLLARYNLERLGQGLGPIHKLDDYLENIETPFNPHLQYPNGVNLPGRDEHIHISPGHHNYELVKLVQVLEQRILDAIDSGHVITPQGAFLSLYQPQGLNILGEIIEGTGHSINPRYYGSLQAVAKQLLGNVPEFNHIWEYTPSALELGYTAVRDPIFYQLFSKILDIFHYYQHALPAYQYNDVVVPGVKIENIEVGDLITYFSDYEVDLSNAVPQPSGHHQEHQPLPSVVAHVKRLDHHPYDYTIHVQSEKSIPNAVVRVYIGPKYNHEGQPIDINEHRHYFFEVDQFVYDLTEGHNVIVRNSHQATGQSYDHPSVHQIKSHVESAIRSQNPYYVVEPQQLYGFPARLTLPKGTPSGLPLQMLVVITAGVHHQPEHYGPVVEHEWQTYQPHHYHVVGIDEYEQLGKNPVDKIHAGYQTVEVIPDFDDQIVTEGNWHWSYLYKKYPGSYYYPHWQQTHYNVHAHHYPVHHESSHHEGHHEGHHESSHHEGHHEVHHGGHLEGHHEEHYGGHYEGHHAGLHSGSEIYRHGIGQGVEGGIGYGQDVGHGVGHGIGIYGVGHGVGHNSGHGVGHSVEIGHGFGHGVGTGHGVGHGVDHGVAGAHHGGIHGMDHGVHHSEAGYHGSGHYAGAAEYHGTLPSGIYQGWKGHEEYLQNYYEDKHISEVIGGVVSLDGKPLGYPLDRPLAESAFYAHNIYVKDIYVHHQDEIIPEY